MAVKLVTFSGAPGARPGALLDGDVLDFVAAQELSGGEWDYGSVLAILQGGVAALDAARRMTERAEREQDRFRAGGALRPIDEVRLLAPVPNPMLIISAGNNYFSHAREMGGTPPSQPTGFIKASGCVVGPGDPIVLPPAAPDMVDYEGELCLIFGRRAYNVPEADALDCVAGYLCGNDVSARDWVGPFHDWMQDPGARRYEPFSDPGELNLRYKCFPTFMPCGPALVTPDEVGDPHALRVRTRVNGELRQEASTGDLIFGIPQLVAYWSRVFEFRPGDMLTTGSPPGVGVARRPPVFLRAGDVVTVEIERLGTLTNPVEAFGPRAGRG